MKGFFITATDTNVGKTVIAGGIAGVLRKQGYDAGVYKPVQSGHLAHHADGDAARLRDLSGVEDLLEDICPYAIEEPLAPVLALRRANKTVTLKDLQREYLRMKEKHSFLIIEGAGGLAVPYVEDGLVVDAARMFALPLIIVARPHLGTVNHTLLTVEYAKQHGLQVAGVIISGYQGGVVEQNNRLMIEAYSRIPILGVVPWMIEPNSREKVLMNLEESIQWKMLQGF
ncbi:MAG TPA: dethiobiotin synthase [Bacillota bacterium]|nr:dethiobiotin synthase [Bacillota bacterium]